MITPKDRERTFDEEVANGVGLMEMLLETVDGFGRPTVLGQYAASTVLAMIYDKEYRERVLSEMGKEDLI